MLAPSTIQVLNSGQAARAYEIITAIRGRPHYFTNRQRNWGTRSYKWYALPDVAEKIRAELAKHGIKPVIEMAHGYGSSVRFYTVDEGPLKGVSRPVLLRKRIEMSDPEILRLVAKTQPAPIASRLRRIARHGVYF